MLRAATFDATGIYRYSLLRTWETSLPRLCFVMLNPSTADAERDDPTIRRCIGFARNWGFGSLEVVNLYAFRATHPNDLYRAPDPIGPENDRYIREAMERSALLIAAWGNHGIWQGRAAAVLALLHSPCCLGVTKANQPRHPLYSPANTQPVPLINFTGCAIK